MKLALVLWGVLAVTPLGAAEPWVLQTGPEEADSVPVDPVQPVDAWRGQYSDGTDKFWVYVTRSPHFFAQSVPSARSIAGTPWTVVPFFPQIWTPAAKTAWLDRWVAEFRNLATYPTPGIAVLFPSILTKG